MRHFLLPFALLLSVSLAAQVPTYVPTDGLVAFYPIQPNQNEWNSTHQPIIDNTVPATDRFGNSNAASFSNGGLVFGGLHTTTTQTFTYSIWVKSNSSITLPTSFSFQNLGNDNHGVIHPIHGAVFGPHAAHAGTGLCVGSNGLYLQEHSHNYQRFAGWASHDFTTWSLVTVVYSNNSPSIYINGSYIDSFTPGDRIVHPSLGHDTNGYATYTSMGIGNMYNEGVFAGQVDEYGIWNRALNAQEVQTLWLSTPPVEGCTDEAACNYDSEANLDDGTCIPSGCMEEGACNYNAAAECEGEACDYSCCPGPGCCGAGTHWDANLATCVVDVPDTVDAACTLMNLQELASGYAALVEQNAALDSLLAACEGDGSANTSGPCSGEDVVTYNGYDYAIVEIGDQCWFAENLRNEAFDDGTPIVLSNSDGDWTANASGPQRCAMNFSSSDADLYGYLYNFASVTSASGLCPSGFHVPTDSEFVTMEVFLGMPASESYDTQRRGESQGVGDKMKDDVLMTGNNSSGFTALPGGLKRATVNGFNYYQQDGYWWTSSSASTDNAWYRGLSNLHPATYRRDYPKGTGFSVRCVKD